MLKHFLSWLVTVAVAAALLLAVFLAPAFADDSTSVVVPVGSLLATVLPIIAFVLLVAFVWLLTLGRHFLPAWAQPLATPAVQQILVNLAANCLNWGVQSVTGATKGQELTLDVGNKVIATAAQEFINKAPGWVLNKLGGVEGVKKWVIAQAEDHGVILPTGSNAQQILNSPPVAAVRSNP